MEAVLLVIHLIVAVAIIAVILIQPSESGGFMGNTGSMANMMTPRRSADFMTRLTTVLAGCFFLTSLFLAVYASHSSVATQKSILDVVPAETTEQKTAPVVPSAQGDMMKPAVPKAPISK